MCDVSACNVIKYTLLSTYTVSVILVRNRIAVCECLRGERSSVPSKRGRVTPFCRVANTIVSDRSTIVIGEQIAPSGRVVPKPLSNRQRLGAVVLITIFLALAIPFFLAF